MPDGRVMTPAELASMTLPEPAQLLLFPQWSDAARVCPNPLLRSALFEVRGRNEKRRAVKEERLAAVDGIELRYTGWRLDQDDYETWAEVMHLARGLQPTDVLHTTSYALLTGLGKTDTGPNRRKLSERLTLLMGGVLQLAVDVPDGRTITYSGTLVQEALKIDKPLGRRGAQPWQIKLNPRLTNLFGPDGYSRMSLSVRRALTGKPLAQWLHGYYASHADPFPIRVETLHALCGSSARDMGDFATHLRDSLDTVMAAVEADGETWSVKVVAGMVHVRKRGRRRTAKADGG
jgi:hypothetical protein